MTIIKEENFYPLFNFHLTFLFLLLYFVYFFKKNKFSGITFVNIIHLCFSPEIFCCPCFSPSHLPSTFSLWVSVIHHLWDIQIIRKKYKTTTTTTMTTTWREHKAPKFLASSFFITKTTEFMQKQNRKCQISLPLFGYEKRFNSNKKASTLTLKPETIHLRIWTRFILLTSSIY